MYNRYIPSTNGSYVCHRVEEAPPPRRPPSPHEPPRDSPPPEPGPQPQRKPGFFQRLLPQSLELDDLLILLILVLLLLDGEEETDSLSVLLTVAAFLILQ